MTSNNVLYKISLLLSKSIPILRFKYLKLMTIYFFLFFLTFFIIGKIFPKRNKDSDLYGIKVKNDEIYIKPPRAILQPPQLRVNMTKNSPKLFLLKKSRSNLLEDVKTIYDTQLENFYFWIGTNFSLTDKKIIPGLIKIPLDQFNDIIDLNLFQLSNIEKLIDKYRDYKTHEKLTKYVEKLIRLNQNPQNCNTNEVMSCDINKSCGFACQIHHLLHCLTVSLAKGKVLIIDRIKSQSYKNFDKIFQPISQTCDYQKVKQKGIKIIDIPIIENYENNPELPTAVPSQILKNISTFHSFPFLWWIGKLSNYIYRMKEDTIKLLNEQNMITRPIVGRTDKLHAEAKFHKLEEYMYWTELYFKKLELNGHKIIRRVYFATDEINLINKAKKEYPEYIFYHNERFTADAQVENRKSFESTLGICSDIYYLSQTDYLVCTFSSQVCRLAYELMNGRLIDASLYFKSLDEIYYFGGQQQRNFNLMIPHSSKDKKIEIDEKFNLRHHDWNGYSKIDLLNTQDKNEYHVPSFKIKENWIQSDFKAFKNFDSQHDEN